MRDPEIEAEMAAEMAAVEMAAPTSGSMAIWSKSDCLFISLAKGIIRLPEGSRCVAISSCCDKDPSCRGRLRPCVTEKERSLG